MISRILYVSLFCFIGLSAGLMAQTHVLATAAETSYRLGDKLFKLPAPTDATDNLALQYFSETIEKLRNCSAHTNDLMLFQCYVKKGALYDVKKDFEKATAQYLTALQFQKEGAYLSDSLTFQVDVYAAASYYHLNNLDSANILLLNAETLIDRYPQLPEKERMYNALGALYYEKGNYHQSKNYFSKALETIKNYGAGYKVMQINFKTNIASSLFRLGLYNESLLIYNNIIKLNGCPKYIYFNLGKVQSSLGEYDKAIISFKKVQVHENPGVLNEIGYALLQLNQLDSASFFLDKFQWFNQGNKLNILDNGINKMYWAELAIRQQRYREALRYLQKAIILFSGNFFKDDIYANPQTFMGTLNPYNLYNSLYKKAGICSDLYTLLSAEQYLILSLKTYQSSLSVLQYIEKSYDTDDSKIFLKKKKQEVYQKALGVALKLYALRHDKYYLQQAFLITEKNKASIIASNLVEKGIKELPVKDQKLVAEERNIKYQIARLKINSGAAGNPIQLAAATHTVMDYEIQLSQVQKKLEQNHFYYNLKYSDSYPSVAAIQERLLSQQALISFQVTENMLHVFILTHNDFKYFSIESFSLLSSKIEDWLGQLKTKIDGRKFNASTAGNFIYNQLISRIQELTSGNNEWIIIPDGILCYLPFESLPSGQKNKYLLETVEISYQLSSRFIVKESEDDNSSYKNGDVLAFAPFASANKSADSAFENVSFMQLPESYNEIKGLGGGLYLDDKATKNNFLDQLNYYPVIHLATHAVSNMTNSSQSYIAFYPATGNKQHDCLFLEELYNINMDKTKLVIISACETGNGEWINNEGIISIARGFTYAGCASTINSLWKADDKATSFILRQFHMYLRRGFTKSKALQQAKIDYINSDALFKTPNYWAHLVLTGDNQPLYRSHLTLAVCLPLFGMMIISITLYKNRKRKKADVFHDIDSGATLNN